MHRPVLSAFVVSAALTLPASAEPLSLAPNQLPDQAQSRGAPPDQPRLGGGFIQFVFGGVGIRPAGSGGPAPAAYVGRESDSAYSTPDTVASAALEQPEIDPRYRKQRVSYGGPE